MAEQLYKNKKNGKVKDFAGSGKSKSNLKKIGWEPIAQPKKESSKNTNDKK